MASEHSREDQNLVTQVHNPPTSREESIQLETIRNKLTKFSTREGGGEQMHKRKE